MSKKTIKMICYGSIARGPRYQSPWEDVWIEYFSGKGRLKQEGPCIVGAYDLQNQIDMQKSIINKNPELRKRDEYIESLQRVKSEFSQGNRFALLDVEMKTDTPDIFINQEWVDKKSAEEAVEWYLIKKGVLKSEPRFKWKKFKDFVITVSVSV